MLATQVSQLVTVKQLNSQSKNLQGIIVEFTINHRSGEDSSFLTSADCPSNPKVHKSTEDIRKGTRSIPIVAVLDNIRKTKLNIPYVIVISSSFSLQFLLATSKNFLRQNRVEEEICCNLIIITAIRKD